MNIIEVPLDQIKQEWQDESIKLISIKELLESRMIIISMSKALDYLVLLIAAKEQQPKENMTCQPHS